MADTPEFPTVAIGERSGLHYRHPTPADAPLLEELERSTFATSPPDQLYNAYELGLLAAEFPEGNFVAFVDGVPVAMGLGARTQFDLENPQHKVEDIYAGRGSGHTPDGEWYYGTTIAVRPEYRRRGIGAELYGLRKGVCETLNLRGIVAGGVIPGYADHVDQMTPDQYIDDVRAGRRYDPTLTFQIENGFDAVCALHDYMTDPKVNNAAALIVWHNPHWNL